MSLLDGLVSWWDLEEASGTRADAHGDHDLTDNNTVGSGAGVVGNAAVFVRTNAEYLSCVSDAFNLGASEWTLDFWLRIDDDGFADPRQLCIMADGNLALQMFYVVGLRTVLDVFSDSGTRYRATLGSALPHGEWLHVTLMRSGGQVSITVEGVGSASANMPAGTPIRGGSSHELRLGDGGDGKRLNGAMDSVGIWSRALSNAEVLALYNGGAGRSYADLAGDPGEDLIELSAAVDDAGETLSASVAVRTAAQASVSDDGESIVASASALIQASASLQDAGESVSGAIGVPQPIEAFGAIQDAGETVAATASVRTSAAADVADGTDTLSADASALVSAAGVLEDGADAFTAAALLLLSAYAEVADAGESVGAMVRAQPESPADAVTRRVSGSPRSVRYVGLATVNM